MEKFIAWNIRWTEDMPSELVEYQGKNLYTEAQDKKTATEIFEAFAKKNDISVIEMRAEPLTGEPIEDKYFRVEAPVPVDSEK